MKSTNGLGVALIPLPDQIAAVRELLQSLVNAGLDFKFAPGRGSGAIPHLSIMQGVFDDCQKAIKEIDDMDRSSCERVLDIANINIWATKIVFLNFQPVHWLNQMHREAFHRWQQIACGDSADRQPFKNITPGQQASLDQTGYPFSLDEYIPHITLAHFETAPKDTPALEIMNRQLSEMSLSKIYFEKLVVFRVEPLGICREILKEWKI